VKRICHIVSQMILYLGRLLQCGSYQKKNLVSGTAWICFLTGPGPPGTGIIFTLGQRGVINCVNSLIKYCSNRALKSNFLQRNSHATLCEIFIHTFKFLFKSPLEKLGLLHKIVLILTKQQWLAYKVLPNAFRGLAFCATQ
jgi:hypothetical protein